MVGGRDLAWIGKPQPTRGGKRVQKFRVVKHLIVAAEAGIFVLQRVEAVRTGRHDLFHIVAIESFDVFGDEHLCQILVSGPACRITVTLFLGSQNGEANPGGIQQPDHGTANLLVSLIIGPGASHPEQHVDTLAP